MVTKNLGPIGSAVLTFIGYKQTDKPNLCIDNYLNKLYKYMERLIMYTLSHSGEDLRYKVFLVMSDSTIVEG